MQFVLLCRYGRWKGRSIGRILCATLVWIIHEVCGTLLGDIGDEILGSSGSSIRPASLQDRCVIDSSSVEVSCRIPRSWGWIRLEARMVAYLILRAVCVRPFLGDCKFRSYRLVKSRMRSSTQLYGSVLYLRHHICCGCCR